MCVLHTKIVPQVLERAAQAFLVSPRIESRASLPGCVAAPNLLVPAKVGILVFSFITVL